jgi:hypothetical protein
LVGGVFHGFIDEKKRAREGEGGEASRVGGSGK